MQNVLLVDADALEGFKLKFKNLALLTIARHYHNLGYNVSTTHADPDLVFASCIFSQNKHRIGGLKFWYPNAEIHVGGSGINFDWLPEEMQKLKPYYELYPDIDYSIGFTTRGCIRRCPFCVVWKKEGKHRPWMHVSEFHDDRYKKIVLLDNNWTANKDWFFDNAEWLIERKIKVDATQGFDARIIDEEVAKQIRRLKFRSGAGRLHLAWDNMKDHDQVFNGLYELIQAGFNPRNNMAVYVLVDFDSTFKEDLHRVEILKTWNISPFIMPYQQIDATFPEKQNHFWVRHLARWVNKRQIFWSKDCKTFKDYVKKQVKGVDKIKLLEMLK